MDLGHFGDTVVRDITSTSDNYDVVPPYTRYIITSNRAAHLKISVDLNAEATTGDLPIQPDTAYSVVLQANEYLSFILAAAETDGSIWITPTS